MTITETRPIVAGLELHRLTLSPSTSPRGGLLFFHGQGDFIDRYPPILEAFVKQGYQCLLTDLPGHGRSPGKRGAVPGLPFLDELLKDSLAQLPSSVVLAGHSMGGLMALRFLLDEPQHFQAAWISSPLLDPMRQAAPWMRVALPIISRLLPRITVGTGVRSEDCGDDQNDRKKTEKGALYHSRISIGWGAALCEAAEEVRLNFEKLPIERPLLFTQGTHDPICPAEILESRLRSFDEQRLTLNLIQDALHEPFTGSTAESFQKALGRWISTNL